MSLLSRLGGKGRTAPASPPPAVEFSNALRNTEAMHVVERYLSGDWRYVATLLEGVTGWEDRSFYLRLLAEQQTFPDQWITATSGSSTSLLVRGMHKIQAAWRARGSAQSHTVTDPGWRDFFALLNQAEDDLQSSASLVPEDPQPWQSLITVANGLELPKEEVLRRFEEVKRRAPGFRPAYVSVITAVAQKWNGSHALMFDIARDATRELPEGSPGRVAIPHAHFLRYQYHGLWEKDEAKAQAYFKDTKIGDEILQAAEASVLSATFSPNLDSAWPRVDFAFGLAFAGDGDTEYRRNAAPLFRAVGDVIPSHSLWTERYGTAAKAAQQYARVRQLAYNNEVASAAR